MVLTTMVLRRAMRAARAVNSSSFSTLAHSSPRLVSAAYTQPKPNSKLGEDALFLAQNAVGVADGVGGWMQLNIDAGNYSRSLMKNCQDILTRQPDLAAKTLLQQAAAHVSEGVFGTSTVCIMIANLPEAKVQVANLGDSRFVYLRNKNWGQNGSGGGAPAWEVLGQTRDQTCGFNTPFQIGKYPPGQMAGSLEFTANDADVYDIQNVRAGDLFVLATDGVFDNVFVKDLVAIIDRVDKQQQWRGQPDGGNMAAQFNAQEFTTQLAQQIGTHALACAKKPSGDTPFSQYAKMNNLMHSGGKMDDISVIVSLVV